jgi:hypothetical protein
MTTQELILNEGEGALSCTKVAAKRSWSEAENQALRDKAGKNKIKKKAPSLHMRRPEQSHLAWMAL